MPGPADPGRPGVNKMIWLAKLRGRADLSNAEFRLLVTLAGYTDAKGRNAYPGPARLARDVCVKDERHVSRMLKRLEERGWIRLVAEGGSRAGEKRQANVYDLAQPDSTPGREHRG